MLIYKIECEWDMGFYETYTTKEGAQKDINEADWEGLCDTTLNEVISNGMVSITEVKVKK